MIAVVAIRRVVLELFAPSRGRSCAYRTHAQRGGLALATLTRGRRWSRAGIHSTPTATRSSEYCGRVATRARFSFAPDWRMHRVPALVALVVFATACSVPVRTAARPDLPFTFPFAVDSLPSREIAPGVVHRTLYAGTGPWVAQVRRWPRPCWAARSRSTDRLGVPPVRRA